MNGIEGAYVDVKCECVRCGGCLLLFAVAAAVAVVCLTFVFLPWLWRLWVLLFAELRCDGKQCDGMQYDAMRNDVMRFERMWRMLGVCVVMCCAAL